MGVTIYFSFWRILAHRTIARSDRMWGGPPGPRRTPSSGLFCDQARAGARAAGEGARPTGNCHSHHVPRSSEALPHSYFRNRLYASSNLRVASSFDLIVIGSGPAGQRAAIQAPRAAIAWRSSSGAKWWADRASIPEPFPARPCAKRCCTCPATITRMSTESIIA